MGDYRNPEDEELRGRLTPEQYAVTQHEATGRPFSNAYWDNKQHGIYVDVVSAPRCVPSTATRTAAMSFPTALRRPASATA